MKTKLMLTVTLAFVLGMQSLTAYAQEKRETQSREIHYSNESMINHIENGREYKIRLEGSKIVELIVDGKEVPPAEYSRYDSMVKKILEQVAKDRAQAEKDRAQAEKDRARAEVDRAEAEEHRKLADKQREEAAQHRLLAEKDRERAEVERKRTELNRQEAEQHRADAEKNRAQAKLDREQAGKDRAQAERDRSHAEKDRVQAEKDRARAEIDRKTAEEDRKLMEAMLDEAVSEKLVESRDALKSLTLNENELLINDVKQSDAMHSRFKAKYLKGAKHSIRFNNSKTFRGMMVD